MRAPPLGELFDLLRSDGFQIGVDDHVRANRLLAREAEWTLETLRVAIGSLIVKDRRDQAEFDGCWSRWLRAAEPELAVIPELPPVVPPSDTRRTRRFAVGCVLGLSAIAVVSWLVVQSRPSQTVVLAPDAISVGVTDPAGLVTGDGGAPQLGDNAPATDARVTSSDASAPIVTDAGVAIVVDAPVIRDAAPVDAGTPDAEVLVAPVTAPIMDAPPPPAYEGWLAVFVILSGAAVAALAAALAARLALRRRVFIPGPWSYRVHYPTPRHPVLGRIAIEDAAADLTWQAETPGLHLDLERSIARTVRSGGLPDLVYARPPAAPEYVVLEDRAVGSERWSFVYDELLRGLQREGVRIARYTFIGSPEYLQAADGKSVELGTLLEHADGLLVIGDGSAGFDPVTDRPAEWITTLRQVSRRLWINPLPRTRWSRGARTIATDIGMEHGVARALEGLRPGGAVPRAVRPFAPVIDRAPSTATAMAALRGFLGEPAFVLVCGMAVAGPPAIAAARWLAELLERPLDEEAWLRLGSIPWIANKTWPPELRERLVASLVAESPAIVDRIAAAADQLLLRSEPRPDTGAHLQWELDLAVRRAERGDLRDAERAFARIGSTPFRDDAARKGEALGFRDRRGRARVAALALGVSLVVLGLDPLGEHASSPASSATPAAKLESYEVSHRESFRILVEGLKVTELGGGQSRFAIGVRPIETFNGSVLDVRSWRMSFGDWAVPPSLEVRDDTRPLLMMIAVQTSLADAVLPMLQKQLVDRLPAGARFGVIEFGASIHLHPFDKMPSAMRQIGVARPALRNAIDRASRILANAAAPRRWLVVISDGTDDGIGPDLVTLGTRAAEAGVAVEVVGYSPDDRRAELFKLGDLARTGDGVFTWARTTPDSIPPQLSRIADRIRSSKLLVGERNGEELTSLAIWAALPDGSAIVSKEVPIPEVSKAEAHETVGQRTWPRFALRVVMGTVAAFALFELLFGWLYCSPRRRRSGRR